MRAVAGSPWRWYVRKRVDIGNIVLEVCTPIAPLLGPRL